MSTGLVMLAADLLEMMAAAVILGGSLLVTVVVALQVVRTRDWHCVYRNARHGIGRAILLGLELLIGADIIRTIYAVPERDGVLVLGLIILIRTFLSFTLEVELDGRWPWQMKSR